jgi:3-phosphoshikimate 1-carboxyvinyltransferase
MSKLTVKPIEKIRGEFIVPGDKSISHRSIMLASLAQGKTEITNFLASEDCLATIQCFKDLGVNISEVTVANGMPKVVVEGAGLNGLKAPENDLYAGNSGTTIRLITGILSAQSFNTVINGDGSLQKRPMKRIITPLSQMGAVIEGDYPPLKITGKTLQAAHYDSPIASAQVKSSILLAGLFCEGETSVSEPALSRDHTERMFSYLGIDIKKEGLKVSVTGNKPFTAKPLFVPGDISSAAYLLVMACVLPEADVLIKNIGINPSRTGIIEVLLDMGADLKLENERDENGEPVADIRVKSSKLKGTVVEGALIPRLIDEIPIIAVAAAFAEGVTEISDAKELRVKESDRIATMVKELQKFGVNITAKEDGMVITGGNELHSAECESYGDHRVAMSCAIAGFATGSLNDTVINDVDCIKTSFPEFFTFVEKMSKG